MTAAADVFLVLVGSSLFRGEWRLFHKPHTQISITNTTLLVLWGIYMVYFVGSEIGHVFRDRDLLSQGDATLGEIVDVKSGRRGSRIVRYTFADEVGNTVKGSSYDFSRKLVVGDHVPIFFDSRNASKRKVPLCGAYWEIAFPSGQLPFHNQKVAAWRSWFRF